ncbi:MAG: hypothetical protein JWM11_7635 [Planctomycetaceae bacterium]|nr:hypothetical protein [Planctomycetaceae bacterium]
MVMLVGIRFFPAPTQKSNRQHATREPRVVCWGLVFPGHVAGAWTAYTFIKSNSKPNRLARNAITDRTAELDLSQVPLPEGCRRTVSVRGSDWNSLSGFQGTGSAADWRTHFSEWLASQGWAPVENWSSTEEIPSWSASFIRNNEDATTSNRILIQFRFDASGQGSGLIHGLPGPTANSKP